MKELIIKIDWKVMVVFMLLIGLTVVYARDIKDTISNIDLGSYTNVKDFIDKDNYTIDDLPSNLDEVITGERIRVIREDGTIEWQIHERAYKVFPLMEDIYDIYGCVNNDNTTISRACELLSKDLKTCNFQEKSWACDDEWRLK